MAHPNQTLISEAFAAFGRGDMDALRNQYFAEDIRWHIQGRNPLAGDYEGVAQVLEAFGRISELSEGTFVADLHNVLANDEQAVALWTARGERAGKQLENPIAQVIDIRDGKWTEVWAYSADQYAFDEFFS
jgi:uncharacterized protein